MKYSLRSLMIVALVLPPLLALGIVTAQRELKKRENREEINLWLEQYDNDMTGSDLGEKNFSHPPMPIALPRPILRKASP